MSKQSGCVNRECCVLQILCRKEHQNLNTACLCQGRGKNERWILCFDLSDWDNGNSFKSDKEWEEWTWLRKKATLFLVSFNCCTEVSHHVPRRLLRKVLKFEIQKDDGVCNIPAVILHVKHKKLCVSAHNKTVKKWMKRNRIKDHRRNGNLHSGKKRNTKRKNQIVVKQ
ncbi:C-C motif chemokine 28 isoform X1 [Gopherus evgoodei]|uniref:C-C motif chemokine 28 isoform X1 n=1 Tax=Gopherus evgoodei TaxID=1825980 RepID=UPI0011CF3EDD|nr:C-C motif chemokine 28 isoform X1 [Gopherus evgoodei]